MVKSNKPLEEKEERMSNLASTWLSTLRTWKGMSQRRLADEIGVSNQTISDAEKKGYASHRIWRRLAEYFGWPVDAVLWMAGFFGDLAPSKEEMIEKIESDLAELPPDVAAKLKKAFK